MRYLINILLLGGLFASVSVKVSDVTIEHTDGDYGTGFVYVSFESSEEIVGFQFSIYADPSMEAQFEVEDTTWSFSSAGSHTLTLFPEQTPDEIVEYADFESQEANFTIFGNEDGEVVGLSLNFDNLNAYSAIDTTGANPKPLLKLKWIVNTLGFGSVTIDDPKFVKIGESGGAPQYVNATVSEPYEVEEGELSINSAEIPSSFELGKAFPNPFNPITSISYSLPHMENVVIRVYDLTGRMINELVNASKSAGHHEAAWHGDDLNGAPVATGTYIYQMTAGNFIKSEKLILIK